ncbi:helix-turn-helix transcriptional regulator [Verticiella sediminum]|uniref:Helix-turn-helix transcriptional regulator n=1 Tax=Verticiella sediminum TaxID=1247510 RepID=A0A556B1I4_9BURK|nr:helix-turn-helix transcriptional regulator [Verticiella sediminum]TSH99030.1 helix-turn-helix transcriptional regulator [Verticiella sediminum]
MSDLAARLLDLMRSHGLRTQSQLARRAGVRQSTIHRILHQPGYAPTLSTLERLAQALGVSLAWLAEGHTQSDPRIPRNRVSDVPPAYPISNDERLAEALAILERLDDEARTHVLAVLRLIDAPPGRRNRK